jgi:putative membrane protein
MTPLISTAVASLLLSTTAAFLPASGSQGHDAKSSARSFLQKAAERQHIEIALGQLASELAGDKQVKQFGVQMIEDHRKASAEIEQLASKEGVVLSTELTGKHKNEQEQFARLSGNDFDRAYMGSMLRDHRRDVKEFERQVKGITDPQVQQWAEATLPLLKHHLRQAQQIAGAIGLNAEAR